MALALVVYLAFFLYCERNARRLVAGAPSPDEHAADPE
jgi:hypothetical protein